MLRISRVQNPWDEDPKSVSLAARAIVLGASRASTQAAKRLPELKAALLQFSEDLEWISEKLQEDPSAFRLFRAFTAVHIPSLLAALDALEALDDQGADQQRSREITKQLAECLQASKHVRQRLVEAQVSDLELDVRTLRNASVSEQSTCDQPPEAPASLAGRVSRRLTGAQAVVESAMTKSYDEVARIGTEAKDRANAGVKASGLYLSGVLQDSARTLTSPIGRHVSALRTTLSRAAGNALADGIVTALVFPPAVPIAIGLALLDSGQDYLNTIDREAERDRLKDKAIREDRALKVQEQIRRIRGQSPIIRLETPHLHVTINLSNQEAKGIILSGAYAGYSLNDIDRKTLDVLSKTAPDSDTRALLDRWKEKAKKARISAERPA